MIAVYHTGAACGIVLVAVCTRLVPHICWKLWTWNGLDDGMEWSARDARSRPSMLALVNGLSNEATMHVGHTCYRRVDSLGSSCSRFKKLRPNNCSLTQSDSLLVLGSPRSGFKNSYLSALLAVYSCARFKKPRPNNCSLTHSDSLCF